MAQKKRPLTDTQVIEKVLAEMHRERGESPERRTPHEAYARLQLGVEDLSDGLRGYESRDQRQIALRLAALAIRFVVEST